MKEREARTTTPTNPPIALRDVRVQYQVRGREFVAVRSACFDVRPGELVCVVGPSGCGKSTLLGAIAGLTPYQLGSIEIFGRPVVGASKNVSVVFQKASLLPWRTALANVAYPLRIAGEKRRVAEERARDALKTVGLIEFADSYPYQLSGGMQQRVNVARALVTDPAILLLDEPFAALDAQQRQTLQNELLRVWESTNTAGIFITHQIDEAVLLGDRVVIQSRGPGSVIRDVIDIDLPRPRTPETRMDPKFDQYVGQIWDLLKDEQEVPTRPRKDEENDQ
ncbi:ABC transporter ATP-binding protein [Nocardioides sp. QY071]|uniref:ABC transporter ATP-binding protein n=1 Tax=Nocardioides sp. QY071 TaxID=3044187 RepID=UPI00249C1F56|nr:ABC transporter ATP-binding protein [Nocardioides sp. QY071]WGY01818.1 ABC transporter ATP-binding protein [Nocardioides sp. QY071]